MSDFSNNQNLIPLKALKYIELVVGTIFAYIQQNMKEHVIPKSKNPTLLVLWWPTTQNDAKWRLKRCDDNFRQYLCFQYNFFCRLKYKNLPLCVGLFNAMVLYCFINLVKISGMSYFNWICYTYCCEEYIQHVIFVRYVFMTMQWMNSYTYIALTSKIYI